MGSRHWCPRQAHAWWEGRDSKTFDRECHQSLAGRSRKGRAVSEEQALLSVLLGEPSSFWDPFKIILLREGRSGAEGGTASRADLVPQRPS